MGDYNIESGLLTHLETFFLFNFYLVIYLSTYGCVGSSFLCQGFLQVRQAGATLQRSAWASHYRGLSCCRAQAPDAQAQQLWLTGLVAPWHVGSSQTRAQTRVPCIGRQILNHCATREAPETFFFLTSLLECNCFTMLGQFLLYNKVNQLCVYVYSHIPSLLHLPPTLPIPPFQVVTNH